MQMSVEHVKIFSMLIKVVLIEKSQYY